MRFAVTLERKDLNSAGMNLEYAKKGYALNFSQTTDTICIGLQTPVQSLAWGSRASQSDSQMERGLPKSLSEKTDEELMLLCQADNNKALEELFKRFSKPLYQFIYRHLNNAETASDLIQETFLRVFQHRKDYRPTSRFSYWIYRIAKNLCVDEKRRYWNRNVSSSRLVLNSEESPVDLIDQQQTPLPDGAELLHRKEMEDIIREAIESLSEEQRQVMIMHKYQGLAYKEIAEILDITTESVKQRAYRAHVRLRSLLKDLLEEKEY